MSNQGYYQQQPQYPQQAYGGNYNYPPQQGYGPPQPQYGYNQGPQMQYQQGPPQQAPPRRQGNSRGCLEGCLAALCCCFVAEEGCDCCMDCAQGCC